MEGNRTGLYAHLSTLLSRLVDRLVDSAVEGGLTLTKLGPRGPLFVSTTQSITQTNYPQGLDAHRSTLLSRLVGSAVEGGLTLTKMGPRGPLFVSSQSAHYSNPLHTRTISFNDSMHTGLLFCPCEWFGCRTAREAPAIIKQFKSTCKGDERLTSRLICKSFEVQQRRRRNDRKTSAR